MHMKRLSITAVLFCIGFSLLATAQPGKPTQLSITQTKESPNAVGFHYVKAGGVRAYAVPDGVTMQVTNDVMSCIAPPAATAPIQQYVNVLVPRTYRFVVTAGMTSLMLPEIPAPGTEVRVLRNGLEMDSVAYGGADDFTAVIDHGTVSTPVDSLKITMTGGFVVGDTIKVMYFVPQRVAVTQ